MSTNVLVVDDSAVIRGLISKTLQEDPNINVVSSASNGKMALMEVSRYDVDVVILDIEMPVMDGMTALPLLLEQKPNLKIIIASTLTLRNADISLEALKKGASDYISKPSTAEGPQAAKEFRTALRDKVIAYGSTAPKSPLPKSMTETHENKNLATTQTIKRPFDIQSDIRLQSEPKELLSALAIASSTGGPQALFKMMGDLRHNLLPIPVFITQHMPPTFTKILANHIGKITPLRCSEAEDGEEVSCGRIYIAPGGYHMIIESTHRGIKIRLKDSPPINFCKPSADPMIESLADIYGSKLGVAVLTGMGSDGLNGCRYALGRNSTIYAQDEQTSVVWGMPGAVAQSGLCSAVLPIDKIGGHVKQKIINN